MVAVLEEGSRELAAGGDVMELSGGLKSCEEGEVVGKDAGGGHGDEGLEGDEEVTGAVVGLEGGGPCGDGKVEGRSSARPRARTEGRSSAARVRAEARHRMRGLRAEGANVRSEDGERVFMKKERFMVSNDLMVRPVSMGESLGLMSKLGIEDESELEKRDVEVGKEKG